MANSMEETTNLFRNHRFASRYDDLVKQQNWYGPEILLGMIFEFLKPGDRILDMGIGTGLSATAFNAMGLEVYGIDYSAEMLQVCAQKGLAADLKQFDLNDTPLPYADNFFDHISANAVLYFMADLSDLFGEISRIIKKKGIWAFIVEKQDDISADRIVEKPSGKNGPITFIHSRQYIREVLERNDFTLLKDLDFIARNFQMEGKSVSFTLYVSQA